MTVIGRKQQPLSCLHGTTAGTRASFCPGHTRPVFPGASATKKQRAVLVSAFEDTEKFLGEVARVSCPAGLEAFMQVLEVEGAEGLAPTATAGLHPHFVPVAQLPAAAGEGGAASEPCIGLLCWGDGKPHAGMELPVVQMTRGSTSMALLACSVEEYVHRRLAEEDAANGPGAIAAAAGQMGQQLYQAGAVQEEQLSRLDAYLVRCVGAFPDVSEDLCEAHLAKGDEMSALITAEWYMKNKVLSGAWARAMEYASALYVAVGRGEEARDTARLALRSPWWTLRDGYSACRKRAQVEGTAEEVMQLLAGKSEEQQQQKRSLGVELPPKAQTAEDRALRQAALLMNKVVAGEISGWDEIRQDLAAVYNEADLPAALLVVAPSQ